MPRPELILIRGSFFDENQEGLEELEVGLDKLGSGKKIALVTGKEISFSFGSRLRRFLNQREKYELTEPQIVERATSVRITDLENFAHTKKVNAFLATGGGNAIDAAKGAAHNTGLPFYSMPSAPSHDGIASAMCSVPNGVQTYSLPKTAPKGVFGYMEILYASPWKYTCAGIWDTIAKLISCKEWELGGMEQVEGSPPYDLDPPYDEVAANICVDHAKEAIDDLSRIYDVTEKEGVQPGPGHPLNQEIVERSLRRLVQIASAMDMAPGKPSSRCGSGLEHSDAHAIDVVLPDNKMLHGAKVREGTILSSNIWKEYTGESIYDVSYDTLFEKRAKCIRTEQENQKELELIKKYGVKIFSVARDIAKERHRFVLTDYLETFRSIKFTEQNIEKILNEIYK